MEPAEAEPLVCQWLEKHGREVKLTLMRYGVMNEEDRAELEQEVFAAAFDALLRDKPINHARSWLKECARKYASNYRRKESLREPSSEAEVVSTMVSPAQAAEDREALRIAFDSLTEDLQELVLALRFHGSSWDEVARERGITIDQARHLYAVAVEQMKAALEREDPRGHKRRILAFPILLALFLDALRANVDNASPELDRRVREGLEHFMRSAGAGATGPESERVSVACPTPSIPVITPPARPMTVGPALGLLGGGLSIGIVIGYLIHGPPLDEPSLEPRLAQSIAAPAMVEPAEQRGDARDPAPVLPVNGSRGIPGELLAQGTRSARSASAADGLKVASSSGSRLLIDRARVASQTGDVRATLALLAEHARSFPEEDAEDRREVRQHVCAAPAARGATECASPPPSSAPE